MLLLLPLVVVSVRCWGWPLGYQLRLPLLWALAWALHLAASSCNPQTCTGKACKHGIDQ
jgi:hypothetical protein